MKTNAGALAWGALVGALLTLPAAALMYLGNHLVGFSFVPFDVFNWVSGVLPGPVITFGIDLMIDTLRFFNINVADSAKTAEQFLAMLTFLLMGVAAGAVFTLVLKARRIKPDLSAGLIMGALFGFPAIAISLGSGSAKTGALLNFVWLLVVFLSWGIALGWAYRQAAAQAGKPALEAEAGEAQVERLNRRQFLVTLGAASAAVTVVGTGLGALLASNERRAQGEPMAHDDSSGPSGNPFPNSDDPVAPVSGTRPEYTPVKDHYKVFIELEPTVIDAAAWKLLVTGMVDNPLMLTIDDIKNNYPPRDQYVTLSCISGRIGTSLISTTYWTGASVQDVLRDAGVQAGAKYLHIRSGDGFYETIPLDLIDSDPRTMFCYAWDGNTLPVDHGFPLRIWIPDRFGMKQPKWITSLEVSDTYQEGYWVERGWDETAQVKTTSVIDTVAVEQVLEKSGQRYVPVGGIAFAGAHRISKVEVSVDGGDWQEAQLRSPLSETTWVIWRYEWPFAAGEHTFEVRCYQGDGSLQVVEASDARPDGATGIHSVKAQV